MDPKMASEVEEKYTRELMTLKINSKPLINSLTMMAEDFIQYAPVVVQVVEKHLARAKPEGKLPVLYLIDSIVKNIKKVYVDLFSRNIVSTFCSVFETVEDRNVRGYLFKLRQTWTDVFPTKTLLLIDVRCNDVDEKWPISVGNTIHVNPKFIAQGQVYPSQVSFPPINPAPEYDVNNAAEPTTEAQMREQLLIKQKQLLELQTKKLELELLQTQAKLDEQSRKKIQEEELKSKLLAQAEIAKQKTQAAASIIARANALAEVKDTKERKSKSPVKTTTSPIIVPVDSPSSDRSGKQKEDKKNRESPLKVDRDKEKEDSVSRSSKKSQWKNRRDRLEAEHEDTKSKKSKSKSPAFSSSSSTTKISDSPSRRSGGSGKDKDDRKSRKEEKNSRREKEREDFASRTRKVLSRNYRKRPGIDSEDDETKVKKSKSPTTNTTDIDQRFTNNSGTDKDVDLRPRSGSGKNFKEHTSSTTSSDGNSDQQQPLSKKSKTSTLIDNLFGLQDVDYRSSWSQVKKPSGDATDSPTSKKNRRGSQLDDDGKNRQVQPPLSPASSVGSTVDALGRPLAFARLPDDPDERRRSLGSRSASIDPLETFRFRYIETPLKVKGKLDESDLEVALSRCKDELEQGIMNSAQFNNISKQLVQLNESIKIRKVQEMDASRRGNNGQRLLNPWSTDATPVWSVPLPGIAPCFPTPMVVGRTEDSIWARGNAPIVGGPRGPNPFVEAAVQVVPSILVPPSNQRELAFLENDVDSTIPLDKIQRHVRFYGLTAIVFVGKMNDEPREISFQPEKQQRELFINREPIKIRWGVVRKFYYGNRSHNIRIGAPTRELYIDGQGYEVFFGGAPTRVRVDNDWVTFRLAGPPPNVEIGEVCRYDLVAGRTTVFVEGNPYYLFLDEKPQILEFGGFTVIAKFSDDFRTITFNGRAFPTMFGGPPRPVVVPNGQIFYIRFNAISPNTEQNILTYIQCRLQQRGPAGLINPSMKFRETGPQNIHGFGPSKQVPELPNSSNPLDIVANLLPATDTKETFETTYEVDSSKSGENATPNVSTDSGPLNVEDLLSKLMQAGLLPAAGQQTPKREEDPEIKEQIKAEKGPEARMQVKEAPTLPLPTLAPVEVVNVELTDNLKKRREKVIDALYQGIQCPSCGLRFQADQNFRYTQHLDWHFRQNRREKANYRKALSRKWYYDLSDWLQIVEVEDIEERATSIFEQQLEEAEESTGARVLDPDSYTVLATGYEGASCPHCGEGFETFCDEEKEEWRLRDALEDSAELGPDGKPKLYHPICHQDYLQSLVEEEVPPPKLEETSVESPPSPPTTPTMEDDEVQIVSEGPKEVVVMEVDLAEDEIEDKKLEPVKSPLPMEVDVVSPSAVVVANDVVLKPMPTTSYTVLSPIVIDVMEEDEDSNIPGIARNEEGGGESLEGNIFGFALNSNSSQSQVTRIPFSEESKTIVYEPMKFDFPKIKEEPLEWNEITEDDMISSNLFPQLSSGTTETLDITIDDDDDSGIDGLASQPSSQPLTLITDIDLTGDDDAEAEAVPSVHRALTASIDGNVQFNSTGGVPAAPAKMKINIAGIDTSSQSPTHKGTLDEALEGGPKSLKQLEKLNPQSPSSQQPDLESLFKTEEFRRIKPRLFGKKLVNTPTKRTGKEESGLCSIM